MVRTDCYWYEDGTYNDGEPYCDLNHDERLTCENCPNVKVYKDGHWVKENSLKRGEIKNG